MTGSAGAPDKQRISRVPRAHPCGTQEKLYHLSDPGDPFSKNNPFKSFLDVTEKALRELLQLINQQGEPVNPFEIRSYGKSELAMLYFPDAKTKKGAMNNLNYWINYCTELREKLRELNSPPHAHRYTRREVELIVEYLCEP